MTGSLRKEIVATDTGCIAYELAIEKIIDTSREDTLQNNIDAFNFVLHKIKKHPYFNCLALFYKIYHNQHHTLGTEYRYPFTAKNNLPFCATFLFKKE